MPAALVGPGVPAGLANFCSAKLPVIAAAIDSTRLVDLLREIVASDRWNSFDTFQRTTRTFLDAYAANGIATELYTVPTGGLRGTGKWIIPEAQDMRNATLDIVAPFSRRILDFQRCPWHVMQWSAATPADGITGGIVEVDSDERLAGLRPGALAGKFALTRLNPWPTRAALSAAGAVGVICDQPVAGLPDAVPWGKFGWGGLDLWEMAGPLVGFSLSVNQGSELRQLLQQHPGLQVHARLDAQRYAGSHDVVSGIVPGQSRDEEIWAIAHSSEPGALDNASGGAACVEIARTLRGLIDTGQLPQPRRTIRFVHAYECYGFFHYLEHHPRFQRPLAGVCLDTIGARGDLCNNQLHWHATAPQSASFVNDIGAAILQSTLALKPSYQLTQEPFVSTEDTLVGDPQYGFPCPWLTNHPFTGYHSSADTPDCVDAAGLANCAAAMAGYLYFLANADTADAMEIARCQTQKTFAEYQASTSIPARQHLHQQHKATLQTLARFAWSGEHVVVAGELDQLLHSFEERDYVPLCDDRTRLIPRRRLPLAPTPENVFPHVKKKMGTVFPKCGLYWADGERSVSEIAGLVSQEAGRVIEASVALEYFEALAELKYVTLVKPAAFLAESDLAAQFRALGLRPGMDVMVHSAMSAIGPVKRARKLLFSHFFRSSARPGRCWLRRSTILNPRSSTPAPRPPPTARLRMRFGVGRMRCAAFTPATPWPPLARARPFIRPIISPTASGRKTAPSAG